MKSPFYKTNNTVSAGSDNQLDQLTVIILRFTLVAWAVAKLSCYKLWLSTRIFPIVSPINLGFTFPDWVSTSLLFASLSMMLALFILPRKLLFLVLLFFFEILSCGIDETRWQAWEYHYLLMSVIFIINWKHKKKIIGLIAILLACTYIYSGIFKINSVFVTEFWQNSVLHKLLHFSKYFVRRDIVHNAGYSLPIIEALGGLFFLFKRTRKVGVILLILMHLFTLIVIGPTGLNYNSTVWPWNLVMIVYLYLIGIKLKDIPFNTIISKKSLLNLCILVLLILMPALNFIGLWPHFFSFCLYSFKAKQLMITVNEESLAAKELSPYFEKGWPVNLADNDNPQFIVHNWAFKEMNTPAFPEVGYYEKVKVILLRKYPNAGLRFYLFEAQNPNYVELK